MIVRMLAGATLALFLGACAPAVEGNEATPAPLPTTTEAAAADGHEDDGHEADGHDQCGNNRSTTRPF